VNFLKSVGQGAIMNKHFLFGAVMILALLSTVWSAVSAQTRQLARTETLQATDGAYRDGLFLGRLDARAGRNRRACVGRWSSQTDRASFASGYEDGYARAALMSVAERK
jgi:hypothetical protein